MRRRKGRATCESSSSPESSTYPATPYDHFSPSQNGDLDLSLGLYPTNSSSQTASGGGRRRKSGKEAVNDDDECNSTTFYVKVYMEGSPIGRKLDLLALDGYHDLIRTLDVMFDTTIIWAEMDVEDYMQCHVLTYEDRERDWLMVGDVPWEMFLCSVKRLKITRAEKG